MDGTGDSIQKVLDDLKAGRASKHTQAPLGDVCRDSIVLAFDNHDRSWCKALAKAYSPEAEDALMLLDSLDEIVLGVKVGEQSTVRLRALARSKGDADRVRYVVRRLLARATKDHPAKVAESDPGWFLAEWLDDVQLSSHGPCIEAEVTLPCNLLQALDAVRCRKE
jgi:hypothetical protein